LHELPSAFRVSLLGAIGCLSGPSELRTGLAHSDPNAVSFLNRWRKDANIFMHPKRWSHAAVKTVHHGNGFALLHFFKMQQFFVPLSINDKLHFHAVTRKRKI
jgi:hypothetical protein